MKRFGKKPPLLSVLAASLYLPLLPSQLMAQTFTTLYSFAGTADGTGSEGKLIPSGNRLYGTTCCGGASGLGSVFSVNADGTSFTVLHSFVGAVDDPQGGLVLSGDTLYGTAASGTVFSVKTNGTGFKRPSYVS